MGVDGQIYLFGYIFNHSKQQKRAHNFGNQIRKPDITCTFSINLCFLNAPGKEFYRYFITFAPCFEGLEAV